MPRLAAKTLLPSDRFVLVIWITRGPVPWGEKERAFRRLRYASASGERGRWAVLSKGLTQWVPRGAVGVRLAGVTYGTAANTSRPSHLWISSGERKRLSLASHAKAKPKPASIPRKAAGGSTIIGLGATFRPAPGGLMVSTSYPPTPLTRLTS